MSPGEELANFLCQRAACWGDVRNKRLEVEALAWACALAPHDWFHREYLKRTMNQWHDHLQTLMPPRFPPLFIQSGIRKFPEGLPSDFERDIVGLTVTEFLLNEPSNIERWWEPMRRGVFQANQPTRITVQCTPHGYDVGVSFS
jgi:hypothetical protein